MLKMKSGSDYTYLHLYRRMTLWLYSVIIQVNILFCLIWILFFIEFSDFINRILM